ncbi:MAG: protein phosphatase [Pseudomonadota bacterium]
MTSALDSLHFGPGLDIAARSCAGASAARRENQDNYLLIDARGRAVFLRDELEQVHQVEGWPQGHARIAVLDGMGGHGHGRQAAEAVVAGLLAIPACATLGELSTRLDALHTSLQLHFCREGDSDDPARRPGTTLTMLELRPGLPALLYHVGDSRLYEIDPDQLAPMTVDHVPATAFAMAGLLDEAQWWQHVHGENRSQISQAFILGNAFVNPMLLSDPLFELSPVNLPPFLYHLADRRAIELRPHTLYLLATDGFWACAKPYEWVGSWPGMFDGRGAQEVIDILFEELIDYPPHNLHIDNITAIALRTWQPAS